MDNFEKLQQVGEGTFGKVFKALDKITNKLVALKKIKMKKEFEGFPATATREIKILQSLSSPFVVKLEQVVTSLTSVFLVFEYLEHDLAGLVYNPDIKFNASHVKCIVKQICQGLEYLHDKQIVHRDLKTSNVLLSRDGRVKLADFGLAKRNTDFMTNRVITLWYRPPELLLGSLNASFEVDIWSLGCVIMELVFRKATFQGHDEISQLDEIVLVMGSDQPWPSKDSLPWSSFITIPKHSRTFSSLQFDEKDLVSLMLLFEGKARITAKRALEHQYFHTQPLPCNLDDLPLKHGDWHEIDTKKNRKSALN